MSTLERSIIEQARSVDLIALVGVPLKKVATTAGGELAGPCPFCGGKDRFHVQPQAQRWRCRVCGDEAGHWADSIEFVRKRDKVNFAEAVERLTGGKPLPSVAAAQPAAMVPDLKARPDRPEAWQKRAAALVGEGERWLFAPKGREVLDYLKGRGFTEETLKAWHIGCLPEQSSPRFEWLSAWGFDGQARKLAIPGGVLIPCFDGGDIAYLKLRRLHPKADEPKYHRIKGGRIALYGQAAGDPALPVVLVEGELSALSIWQSAADLVQPLATGSAEGCRNARSIARLAQALRVLVAFDADEAGEKQAAYWLRVLSNAERWRPWWGDPNDLAQADAVRAWLTCNEVVALMGQPADACRFCGAMVERYSPDGRPYCAACYDRDPDGKLLLAEVLRVFGGRPVG